MKLKKLVLPIALLATVTLASCNNVAPKPEISNFVPSIPDVPLPEGFEVDPVVGSFFDSADGRIAETYAAGFDEPKAVAEFYTKVMPQLGWQDLGNLSYQKEGEILTVEAEKGDVLTTVKYNLKPSM